MNFEHTCSKIKISNGHRTPLPSTLTRTRVRRAHEPWGRSIFGATRSNLERSQMHSMWNPKAAFYAMRHRLPCKLWGCRGHKFCKVASIICVFCEEACRLQISRHGYTAPRRSMSVCMYIYMYVYSYMQWGRVGTSTITVGSAHIAQLRWQNCEASHSWTKLGVFPCGHQTVGMPWWNIIFHGEMWSSRVANDIVGWEVKFHGGKG